MEKIYVVIDCNLFGEENIVKAFEDPDEATLFCMEKNRNTCHTFFMVETDFIKKGK